MTETIQAKPSLVRKLASVMGASERVAKNGFNKFHNYAYATESDITAAVRAEMATQGVMMIPTVESIEWSEVTTKNGGKERLCTVHWLFTLLDADSESKIEFRNIGQGQDAGDKSFYKAATGAVKYALLKLFLIPTGDDPESASPEADHRPTPEEVAAAEAAKKERAAGLAKMVAAFGEFGVTEADLVIQLKHPIATTTNDEWAKLRKAYDGLRAAKKDPDEAARLEVQRQAETSLIGPLTSALQHSSEPLTQVQKNALFASLVGKVLAAQSQAVVAQLAVEFSAATAAKWTPGDAKAFNRACEDRVLVLKDAQKPRVMSVKDDVP